MHISAPGKLFISGEWAILKPSNIGLVAAIDRCVHVEIKKSKKIRIELKDYELIEEAKFDCNKLVLEKGNERFRFAKAAIETALTYLNDTGKNIETFNLHTWGDDTTAHIDGKQKKLGFGSSASATVAIVSAVLAFHGIDISTHESRDVIYKLSIIAHFFAQGKVGSGFDIAASTYGGIFVYSSFDPRWLMKYMESGAQIREIVEEKWPLLFIEQLEIPENFNLIVGWTKTSAPTSKMIKQMNDFRKKSEKNSEKCDHIFSDIANIARRVIEAWRSNDEERIIEALKENEKLLFELGCTTCIEIETRELKRMSDIANSLGGAGKLSGAGGGDCGIAVCFDASVADKIRKAWEKAEIYMVDVSLNKEGVRIQGL